MGRSPQYPLTIEFPASLQRWAAGFDLTLIDKEPAFVPRPAAEVPYEAVSMNPLRVWEEFWMLPLSQLRPYLRDISPLELSTTARVVKFVDHYGPLTRNPFGGDAAPDVTPLPEWRELQAELRSVFCGRQGRPGQCRAGDIAPLFGDHRPHTPHATRRRHFSTSYRV